MNTKAHTMDTIQEEQTRAIFMLLGSALALLVVLYGVFMFMAVRSAMAQRTAFNERQSLSKDILTLESSYGVLKESVTIERASEFGLVPLSNARFASRAETVRLTLAPR